MEVTNLTMLGLEKKANIDMTATFTVDELKKKEPAHIFDLKNNGRTIASFMTKADNIQVNFNVSYGTLSDSITLRNTIDKSYIVADSITLNDMAVVKNPETNTVNIMVRATLEGCSEWLTEKEFVERNI